MADETADLVPGPVVGWRLFGGGRFTYPAPRLFARFAPLALVHFGVDESARDFAHPSWAWVDSLAEPLPSTCLVDATHTETPAPGCGCGWRVVTDYDELADYVARKAGRGDHYAIARVETVGTLRASHATADARPDGRPDDPPTTVRAEAIRVLDVWLSQECHIKPDQYGSPEAWAAAFGSDANVVVPPPHVEHWWRPHRDRPPKLSGIEYMGIAQWLDWIKADHAEREATP